MTPELQTFAQKDAGFRQFCEQYKRVASDPKTRDEYFYWWLDESRKISIEETIKAESKAEGKAEGERKRALKDAKAVLALGVPPEQVAMALELPLSDVLALR